MDQLTISHVVATTEGCSLAHIWSIVREVYNELVCGPPLMAKIFVQCQIKKFM